MSYSEKDRRLKKRVVVVGGGITGLAAAHRMVEISPSVELQLLEAGPRLGGVLETIRDGGCLIETSADNFITNVPWAVDLCKRIGFDQQLIPTEPAHRQAMVLSRGRLRRVPDGFVLMSPTRMWPILTTRLLSPAGKLRLLAELFIPRKSSEDESLASFVRRRFGPEVFERLVQPLIGGIYTADPEKLSLAATLPRFLEMERQYGSLIRAARLDRASRVTNRETSGARYSLFTAPRGGMTTLVEAIASRLPAGAVQFHSRVARLQPLDGDRWRVVPGSAAEQDSIECDAIILATPAGQSARMVSEFDAELAGLCSRISYAGTAIVALVYYKVQLGRAIDAFGFVVPEVEQRQILAASFSSVKYAGRAPADQVLVRVFIGGACHRELLDLSDDGLRRIAHAELADILKITGDPALSHVVRWTEKMPQYHVGHLQLVQQIEKQAARWPSLQLAGNAYRGVGIPYCIHSGQQAAERIAKQLTQSGV